MKNLKLIQEKYAIINCNSDNYSVGGGLSESGKKASRRHEDACNDAGKLTFGKACQMFKKATGSELLLVKEVINYAIPYMEWHHAGFIPNGRGMKTYFLNAKELENLAKNWKNLVSQLEISKTEKRVSETKQRNSYQTKQEFLQKNAKKVVRTQKIPEFFYETEKEMNGKYGWFSSYGKSYKLPEYFTGWVFESQEKINEFYQI